MLLTVTPNACIERTVVLETFAPGEMHRVSPERLHVNAGGKGINAARVASRLGCETVATAWVGRGQIAWFRAQLEHEGIPHDLVEVEADARVCTNILDRSDGASSGAWRKTEIVEAGTSLGVADGTRLLDKFETLLERAALVVIGGSYPPASDPVFDAHLTLLTHLAMGRGVRVLIDGKGRPFEMAVRSRRPPWAIKPNLDEAAALLHHAIEGEAAERRAVQEMLRFGVEVVLLSCDARGAWLGTAQGVWFFQAPPVETISPVGSGDAMTGAFAAKFLATGDLNEAARWGVAAGAANAAQVMSAFCTREEIAALVPQVRLGGWVLPLASG